MADFMSTTRGGSVMQFSICFLDEPLYLEDGAAPAAHGLLSIGNFREAFYSSLAHWSQEQYRKQWCEAILAIVNGATKSALIVDFPTPDTASHLEWWPIYRVNDTCYLQDHLLFFDQLTEPFSPDLPIGSLKDRETVSENGDPISEWSVPLSELDQFLRSEFKAN
jgi:hypothetical protein